ncbi:MAG: tetratricopeptide repeat protein [Bradymonadaceae bacterium]
MLNRLTVTILVGIIGYGTLLNEAHADDMDFGEDEVAAIGEIPHIVEMIEEGKALYEQKKYAEASLLFHTVLRDDTMGAEIHFPEAEYELAKTLFRMELYQGALAYFGRIVDEGDFHPFYTGALHGLLLLGEAVPGDALLTERLSAFSDRFPHEIPDEYRDAFAYSVGLHFYNTMEIDEALRMLNAVTSRSSLYAKARYITAITHVANYDAKPAVDAFRDVLRYLMGRNESGSLNAEERQLLELAQLGMARVFYSTGQFDTSLRYYSQIRRTSPLWLDALFESSWAYFQVDRFNHALGNLHTLNSPFFADAHYPEGPILSAVIYFYNCNYPRVRNVLEDFEYHYEGLKNELDTVLDQHQDPMDMYGWVTKMQSGEGRFDAGMQSIFRASLQDQQIQQRFNLVESINREKAKKEAMPESWKTSRLGDTLIQEATLAHSFAMTDAGELAQQRLQRVVRELDELVLQQKRIMFEVARAERGEIESDIRAGMLVDGHETPTDAFNVTDEHLYWTFDGEYWRDELGFYVFSIGSECRR